MFDAPGWFAVLVAGRMIHCILDLLAARSERRKAFTAMAEVQIGFCFVKGLALFGVAWFALFFRYAGPWGVAAFVVL